MNSCIVHTKHYCEENEYITLFGRIELDILTNFSSSWDQCSPELSVCVLADVGPKCFEISSQLAQIQSGLDTKCCPFYEFISNVQRVVVRSYIKDYKITTSCNHCQLRTLQENCTLQTILRLSSYNYMYVCILGDHCILSHPTHTLAPYSRPSTTFDSFLTQFFDSAFDGFFLHGEMKGFLCFQSARKND